MADTIKSGALHSRYVLPASWALYNAVGPVLFFAAAGLKRTRSLEMAVYVLSTVGGEHPRMCARLSGCACGGHQHKLDAHVHARPSQMHTVLGIIAIVSLWFVNSRLSIGFNGANN